MYNKPIRLDTSTSTRAACKTLGIEGIELTSGLLGPPLKPKFQPAFDLEAAHLTPGPDPRQLIEQTLKTINSTALRKFLGHVLADREVAMVLTPAKAANTPNITQAKPPASPQPIERLRRAGDVARFWSVHGVKVRETLYVATILRGVQELLAGQFMGDCGMASDMLFAIARPALHRLDDEAPLQASLLRLALGWVKEDEIDASYVLGIPQTLLEALSFVGLTCKAKVAR